jgi:hypothetical protein
VVVNDLPASLVFFFFKDRFDKNKAARCSTWRTGAGLIEIVNFLEMMVVAPKCHSLVTFALIYIDRWKEGLIRTAR